MTLIFLIGATFLITACSSSQNTQESVAQAAPQEEEQENITPVEVATVEKGDISLIYSYAGNLQSKDEVTVLPAASGRVESVLVEVGDEVKAGDPIATVERDRYIEQVRQHKPGTWRHHLRNLLALKVNYRVEDILVAVRRAWQYKVFESGAIERFLEKNSEPRYSIKLSFKPKNNTGSERKK